MREIFFCDECHNVWWTRQWKRQAGYVGEFCPECGRPSYKLPKGGNMNVELVNYTDQPELEIAERSSQSHDGDVNGLDDAKRMIGDFIEWGHYSTLEFASATFDIEDISRSCLAQLTRHRHASYMVKSQRYNRADEEAFVVPKELHEWADQSDKNMERFNKWLSETKKMYSEAVDDGVPKEDARFMMPLGTTTSLSMTANFREWRHIISLRGLNDGAQWEIRQLALEILEDLYDIAPSVFEDQYLAVDNDG